MVQKEVETIIVGGGIAGLGCARTLQDNNRPFLLITENVGGRILTSKDRKVNYGAYYVGNDYTNVLKYVEKKRILVPLGVEFHRRDRGYFLLNYRFLLNFRQFMRLMFYYYENLKFIIKSSKKSV